MAPPSSHHPLVIDVPDPSLVVLVGAAGAGKSTFAARHFAPDEVLSSDAFRALVAGDPADQAATRPAFAALHRAAIVRLRSGRLTVIDATNVQPHARRALVARATEAGVPVVAIVLDLPADVVLARNAARVGSAVVPEPALRRQLDALAATVALDPAMRWPGFAAVHHLRAPAAVDAVVVRRIPRT
jgi:protein phosphatase